MAADDEPTGPGSSVSAENRPDRLVGQALVAWENGMPFYTFHTSVGRSISAADDSQYYDQMPGVDMFKYAKALMPNDSGSWGRYPGNFASNPVWIIYSNGQPDASWEGDPSSVTEGTNRAYTIMQGDQFITIFSGVVNYVHVVARNSDLAFHAVDPTTGKILQSVQMKAGGAVDLSGAGAIAIIGNRGTTLPPPPKQPPQLQSGVMRIEAEDFDQGGEGVAYHDTTPGNQGGAYRQTDVDIGALPGGGYFVGWVDAGEWTRYTINVQTAGNYVLRANVATPLAGSQFHFEVDGQPVSGTMTAPVTGDWGVYQVTVPSKSFELAAGQHIVRLVTDTVGANYDYFELVNTAYNGTPAAIPGKVEAENFDNGGEGSAYHDTTPGNTGGSYRQTDVDVGNNGAVFVGWTEAGEWLTYTVNVASSGYYSIAARVAAAVDGTAIHVEADGTMLGSQIAIPNTGDWAAYQVVSSGPVPLTAGIHVLKLVIDKGAPGPNIDYLDFEASAAPPVTFFHDANFGGASFTALADQPDLRNVANGSGNWNDTISSLQIPSGITVTLYSDVNFGGASVDLNSDTPDLSGMTYQTSSHGCGFLWLQACHASWNDSASSFKISGYLSSSGSGSGSLPGSGQAYGLGQLSLTSTGSVTYAGYQLDMQGDGNLVVYTPAGQPVWATGTSGRACSPSCTASFQADGNLVLYENGSPYWASNTDNQGATALIFNSSAPYLQIVNGTQVLWSAQ
jgi:hypothetical protein